MDRYPFGEDAGLTQVVTVILSGEIAIGFNVTVSGSKHYQNSYLSL